MRVGKRFKFDAAHHLPGYDGKCSRPHGHTWYLKVTIQGEVNKDTGFVMDFGTLKEIITTQVLDLLDHQDLNGLGLPFSDNPTCEQILEWIWEILEKVFRSNHCWLQKLTLYESLDSFAELP